MTTKDYISLAKHANRKAIYYLDRMMQQPVFSGKHIDLGVRAQQYLDYAYSLSQEAFKTLSPDDYKVYVNSIAD